MSDKTAVPHNKMTALKIVKKKRPAQHDIKTNHFEPIGTPGPIH
jgi:hypothetical protein